MLENGIAAQLSSNLTTLTEYFLSLLKNRLTSTGVNESQSLGASFDSTSNSSAKIPARLLTLPSFLLNPLHSVNQPPPSPLVPLLTPHPHKLSRFLLTRYSIIARPITYPTVPKGADRVRVCIHGGNSADEVELLVHGIEEWVESVLREEMEMNVERRKMKKSVTFADVSGGVYTQGMLVAKL